jgi:hypothetical protein
METMRIIASFRALALTKEIEQPLSRPPHFTRRPGELVEKLISIIAGSAR